LSSRAQRLADSPGVLVVEVLLPPVASDVLGQEDNEDVVLEAAGGVLEIADQGPNQLAIGRFDDDKRDARNLTFESASDLLPSVDVVSHVDRGDVGRHRSSELDRLDDVPRHLRDGDDDVLATER